MFDCQTTNRLPQEWIDILVRPLFNPSGHWSDFNKAMTHYNSFKKYTGEPNGFFCDSDLPEVPNPSDYSSLE